MNTVQGVVSKLGPAVFGLAMVAFGVQSLLYGDGVTGLAFVPGWLPSAMIWAYLTGILLVVAGLGLLAKQQTSPAAVTLAIVLTAWVVLLQAPRLIGSPYNGGWWTTTCETLALCGAAWVLTGIPGLSSLGRLAFGACLFVFCALHFVYRDYVASVIPAWIPGHYAWTYATAIAFAAAGVSILSGVRARLAATLLGVMYGTWVVILHLPRAVAAGNSRPEWTSLCIALAMCGASWIIATHVRR
jgi:uncharacterized membrane protein